TRFRSWTTNCSGGQPCMRVATQSTPARGPPASRRDRMLCAGSASTHAAFDVGQRSMNGASWASRTRCARRVTSRRDQANPSSSLIAASASYSCPCPLHAASTSPRPSHGISSASLPSEVAELVTYPLPLRSQDVPGRHGTTELVLHFLFQSAEPWPEA